MAAARTKTADVLIVGAGILGLADAYWAACSGQRVVVFERNPGAIGASIRNFGMIRPIGQPAGGLYELALRSRKIWLEVLEQSRLWFSDTGSLHVMYRQDEAEVAKEFSDKALSLGYECSWLTPEQTLHRTITSGLGMTLAFGIAEQTFRDMGVVA